MEGKTFQHDIKERHCIDMMLRDMKSLGAMYLPGWDHAK
jgi:hypothetical protein